MLVWCSWLRLLRLLLLLLFGVIFPIASQQIFEVHDTQIPNYLFTNNSWRRYNNRLLSLTADEIVTIYNVSVARDQMTDQ
jgi:hypothetical protein